MNKMPTLFLLTFPFQAIAQSNSLKSPQNLSPTQGTQYTQAALTTQLIFKWKPESPSQEAPTKYRLKIWQLMVGQNITQAMKVNQPLITKDVKFASQTIIFGLISGPYIKPYIYRFVWTVQALNIYGAIGPNNGTSKPTTFSISQF